MTAPAPLFLFTDFGWSGPYVGQLVSAVLAVDRAIPVVSLMHDAPGLRPDLAAYLLPAVCRSLPPGAVVVAVVDPGVGSSREALIVEAGGRRFVGPDNGLLSRLPSIERVARILWRPEAISASFHGRDLFAPVAARLAAGQPVDGAPVPAHAMVGADWPGSLAQVIYIDGYGNAMTGLLAADLAPDRGLRVGEWRLAAARTFSDVPPGRPFWYPNSQGLVEIAINGASAAHRLSLALGDGILID